MHVVCTSLVLPRRNGLLPATIREENGGEQMSAETEALEAEIDELAREFARKNPDLVVEHVARLVFDQIRTREAWRELSVMWARERLENLVIDPWQEVRNEKRKAGP